MPRCRRHAAIRASQPLRATLMPLRYFQPPRQPMSRRCTLRYAAVITPPMLRLIVLSPPRRRTRLRFSPPAPPPRNARSYRRRRRRRFDDMPRYCAITPRCRHRRFPAMMPPVRRRCYYAMSHCHQPRQIAHAADAAAGMPPCRRDCCSPLITAASHAMPRHAAAAYCRHADICPLYAAGVADIAASAASRRATPLMLPLSPASAF